MTACRYYYYSQTTSHFQFDLLTSSSLWFLMPRTRSWRFLSNMRSMLPFTIFRAMMAVLLRVRLGCLLGDQSYCIMLRGRGCIFFGLKGRRCPALFAASIATAPGGNGWQNGVGSADTKRPWETTPGKSSEREGEGRTLNVFINLNNSVTQHSGPCIAV